MNMFNTLRFPALTLATLLLPISSYAGCFSLPALPNGTVLPTIKANTPTSVFTINGDGTVTDTRTALTWKACPEDAEWERATNTCIDIIGSGPMAYTWEGALAKAKALNDAGGFAGSKGWRLPNVKELMSIVEKQCSTPNINEKVFPPGFNTNIYWTSSPVAKITPPAADPANKDKAWAVPFGEVPVTKTRDTRFLKSSTFLVRLVRD